MSLDPQKSLQVIEEMILQTRTNFQENGHLYLIWGYSIAVIALLHAAIQWFTDFPYHFMVWWLCIIPGIIYSVMIRKRSSSQNVSSYITKTMKWLWFSVLAFLIFSLVLGAVAFNYRIVYPFIIMIIGFGSLVSGGILSYRPLITGGLIGFSIGVLSAFFSNDIQLILLAFAITSAYTIPGHMLKANPLDHA